MLANFHDTLGCLTDAYDLSDLREMLRVFASLVDHARGHVGTFRQLCARLRAAVSMPARREFTLSSIVRAAAAVSSSNAGSLRDLLADAATFREWEDATRALDALSRAIDAPPPRASTPEPTLALDPLMHPEGSLGLEALLGSDTTALNGLLPGSPLMLLPTSPLNLLSDSPPKTMVALAQQFPLPPCADELQDTASSPQGKGQKRRYEAVPPELGVPPEVLERQKRAAAEKQGQLQVAQLSALGML
jgi:hypothetical protein